MVHFVCFFLPTARSMYMVIKMEKQEKLSLNLSVLFPNLKIFEIYKLFQSDMK